MDIRCNHGYCEVPVHRSWPITSSLHECSLASLGLGCGVVRCGQGKAAKLKKERNYVVFRFGAKLMVNVMY